LAGGGAAPGGGDAGAGLDLGALGAEPEGGAPPDIGGGGETAPSGGDTGGGDDTLLAAPGKRDDRLTSTPASKGKVYLPVKYRGGDRRPAGARTRNYQSKFSKELGGGSMRNVMGSGAQDLFGLGNGIYEEYENNYNKEIVTESNDTKEENPVEKQIMENSNSLKKLLSSLEKKNATRKETDEE
jgi:hypothetical protein